MTRNRLNDDWGKTNELLTLFQEYSENKEETDQNVVPCIVLYKDGSGYVQDGGKMEKFVSFWNIEEGITRLKKLIGPKFSPARLEMIAKLYHLSNHWTFKNAVQALKSAGMILTAEWLEAKEDDFSVIMNVAREIFDTDNKVT